MEGTLYTIDAVDFSLLTEDDIKNIAVMEITTVSLYKRNSTEPAEGGLLDRRLGVCRWESRSIRCKTCDIVSQQSKRPYSICPGHWSYIQLAQPVYNTVHVTRVLKLLRSICHNCSRILLTEEQLDAFRKDFVDADLDEILRELEARCKNNKPTRRPLCPHCTCKQNYYQKDNTEGLCLCVQSSNNERSKLPFTAYACKKLFERISDEDAAVAGFSKQHPKHMLSTVIAVPPISLRSSMASGGEGNKKRENRLTTHLLKILRQNKRLNTEQKQKGNVEDHRLYPIISVLQTTINNYRSILINTLTKKDGLVRLNLMGKRVDHSARTVITPDPCLKVDEVGVPQRVCMQLTKQEIVTTRNIDDLYTLIRNGPENYPGANYVVTQDGTRIPLMLQRQEPIQLRCGYIVERHLRDGDIVVMNRQPSLHKLSMHAHKVKVLPGNSFRLNLAITSPYNADFDGDEMNMHSMTTDVAVCEAKELMLHQVINPKDGKPAIGLVQDSLLAAYLMSLKDVFIEREQLFQLLMNLYEEHDESRLSTAIASIPTPAILSPKQLWTGKQLLSMVIPKKIFLERPQSVGVDGELVIHDGQLLLGRLDKKVVGVSGGSLQNIIVHDISRDAAIEFTTFIQFIVNDWLAQRGFSVGITDFIISKPNRTNIENMLAEAIGDANAVSGKNKEDTTNKILNAVMDRVSTIVKESVSPDNSMLLMAEAGSKGSMLNLAQTIGCLGQQNLGGQRITPRLRSKRNLPHFTAKEAQSAEACGFIDRGYALGISCRQLIPHCKAGREGLIDTAVRTAITGYFERRLIKSLEVNMVAYDGTVRNSAGEIVQFAYGADGMDPTKIEPQQLLSFRWTEEEFVQSCIWKSINSSQKHMLRERKLLKRMYNTVIPGMKTAAAYYGRVNLPVNISRLITAATHKYGTCSSGLKMLRERAAELLLNLLDSMHARSIRLNLDAGLPAMQMLLLEQLCSKQVALRHKLSIAALEWILKKIEQRWSTSAIAPGESVGITSAHSIAEPITQGALNTHHHAGVSSMDVTKGLPRIQELLSASKHPTTPFVKLRVMDEACSDGLLHFCHALERANLCALIERGLLYSGNTASRLLASDRELLELWYDLYDDDDGAESSKHGLALYFNPKMLDCFMLSDIQKYIDSHLLEPLSPNFFSIASDDNECEAPVIHIRFKVSPNNNNTARGKRRTERQLLLQKTKQIKKCRDQLHQLQKLLCTDSHKKDVNMLGFKGFRAGQVDKEMQKLMLLMSPHADIRTAFTVRGCDSKSFYCNHVIAVQHAFGIHAARKVLRREIQTALEESGTHIDQRNVLQLVDAMTRSGRVLSIDRNGISKEKNPLMKCTFEQTYKALAEASVKATFDAASGSSECIMLGKPLPVGTGCVRLISTQQQQQEPSYCNQMEDAVLNAPPSPDYSCYVDDDDDDDDEEEEDIYHEHGDELDLPYSPTAPEVSAATNEYDPTNPWIGRNSRKRRLSFAPHNTVNITKNHKTVHTPLSSPSTTATTTTINFNTLFNQVQLETLYNPSF